MTDKEILDNLVAEIKRRIAFFKKQSVRKITTDDNSCALALQGVLGFYDSMQEECNITGIKSKEATGKLKECIDNITDESLAKARKQLQEDSKECMYSKGNYTDEDRKVLCEGCEEECMFNKKEYSVNNGLDLGCGVIWKDKDPVSEEQVKESLISKHDNETCKENGNSLTQEPVSIDFEQELYKAFGQVKDFTLSMRIAKWFYDMGKNSQEPVSEDLKEEMNKMFPILGHTASTKLGFYDTARHFANWQKQQLMAKAVDGVVVCNMLTHGYKDIVMKIPSFINVGDKVKVIVIKED